ncbi:MAG: rhomboid family intramembrane serine protease [Bacteroidales bacterium]
MFNNNNNRNPFGNYRAGGGFNNIKNYFKRKDVLPRLILINIIIFLIINLSGLFGWFFKIPNIGSLSPLAHFLAIPAHLPELIKEPWTIITYMFSQEGFFHLLFNMLVLFFSGKIFLQFLSSKKLLLNYIAGGITGAFFFILSYNIFPVFHEALPVSVAIGSSASVLAILVAAAAYVPDFTIHLMLFGRIKLKYLAIILVVIDFLSIRNGGNAGGHISHIGGAFFGFLFGFLNRKHSIHMNEFFKQFFKLFKLPKRRKFKVYEGGRPITDEEYNNHRAEKKHHLDDILDKISKYGYDKLSKEEKEFLFKQSNKNKQ